MWVVVVDRGFWYQDQDAVSLISTNVFHGNSEHSVILN